MFLPELERYLAPQEAFEDLRREALSRFAHQLVDLSYANPHDRLEPTVIGAVRDALASGRAQDFQYSPYGGSTIARRVVAETLTSAHGHTFSWRDVVLTPGAMAALNLVFRALVSGNGDDEVIVVTPCWLDYPLYLANLGIRPRFVPVDDRTLHLDIDAIAAALGPSTRAIIFSQPANPSGIIYGAEELRQLADVLNRQPIPPVLISDECYRTITFEPATFVSPLAHYDNACVVYSFGKNLLMQGQRIGYAAVSPRMTTRHAFARKLERLCRVMGFCTPTSLMQMAILRLADFKIDMTGFSARRDRMLEALRHAGYTVIPPAATFFVYPRTPIPDDTSFARSLAERGVLVLPSSVFHHPGFFRITLTASDKALDVAASAFREMVIPR